MGYTTRFKGAFTVTPPLPCAVAAELRARIDDENWDGSKTPGSYCQWRPTKDGAGIEWDQGEKFYSYDEWIEFLAAWLAERGHTVGGSVQWQGEEIGDSGVLSIVERKAVRSTLTAKAWAEVPEHIRRRVLSAFVDALHEHGDTDDERDGFIAALSVLGHNVSQGKRV